MSNGHFTVIVIEMILFFADLLLTAYPTVACAVDKRRRGASLERYVESMRFRAKKEGEQA